MAFSLLGLLALAPTLRGSLAQSLQLDITQQSSIVSAAAALAANTMSYYTGYELGNNPGNLPPPYYWWEAGGMFAHMIDYWYYTGDDTYNWKVRQAIASQAGADGAFMPANQTTDEGNDDQVFWGFTAMEAAELNFEPPLQNESTLSYIAMAQAVSYTMAERWDTTACGGGLRWQTQPFKGAGYTYKNSVANGGFFFLNSRLTRYTGNSSYLNLAERSWDWFSTSVLYNSTTFQINDGAQMTNNCTQPNTQQWSYNYSLWIGGLAYLYNYSKDDKWLTPLQNILGAFFKTFFANDKVLSEFLCEDTHNCDADDLSFKSYDMRWLVLTMQMVPELKDTIWPYYRASAIGAAGQCSGPNNACGYNWSSPTYDAPTGLGQEMSALAAVGGSTYNVDNLALPLTLVSGGTSRPVANPAAQVGNSGKSPTYVAPITTADRAGAWILTVLCVACTLAGTYWIVIAAD